MIPEDEASGSPGSHISQAPAPTLVTLPEPPETRFLKWLLFGSQGLRVGWSAALFALLFFFGSGIVQTVAILTVAQPFHIDTQAFNPASALFLEIVQLLPIAAAMFVCALVERRRIADYYLGGPRPVRHALAGLAAGLAALSVLVAALHAGGWLRFGPPALHGADTIRLSLVWGLVFALTGLVEEGSTRCYLLFTLARGIDFRWALGSVAAVCLFAGLNSSGNGTEGVYAMAALGLAPCLILQVKRARSAGFWQAAWFTSTLFGYIHTFNHGETWIGIFAASAVGAVFCVSIRVTGAAWWAIGFHAAWDWAQTFLYGTADSGLAAPGHYFTSTPIGPAIWSGGAVGPEGSILVLPTLLLVVMALLALTASRARRPNALESPSEAGPAQLS